MADDAASRWRERGALFDLAPDDYVDGRPGYPDQLFQLLAERCGLGEGTSGLEVGAGAGQASLPILSTGAQMTLVEPGRALAERLARRTVGMDVQIIVDRFEDADLPLRAFDIVAAATAFHWVDPDVGYLKCASLLRAAGWLALPDDVREELLDDVATLARDRFSGIVIRPYQTVLYLAQRFR